jgi:hypothetical protein
MKKSNNQGQKVLSRLKTNTRFAANQNVEQQWQRKQGSNQVEVKGRNRENNCHSHLLFFTH